MKWTSMLAVYFIIWWVTLFVVLPFGVKNAAETGEVVEEGNDAGAPIAHGLLWKAGVTTVLSALVYAAVYVALVNGVLEKLPLPFMRDLNSL